MPKDKKEFTTRTEKRKKQKSNRILNALIAIVVLLIAIKAYSIIFNEDDGETPKNVEVAEEKNELKQEQSQNLNNEKNEDEKTVDVKETQDEKSDPKDLIVTSSNDDIVEKVIVDQNWKVTPTQQTGPHESTFIEGHIDYEEKKLTIRNAVGLDEDNIIYWSVKNDGTNKGVVSVVSSYDQTEKYRVHIKWIENSGWIPVKVEVLKYLDHVKHTSIDDKDKFR